VLPLYTVYLIAIRDIGALFRVQSVVTISITHSPE